MWEGKQSEPALAGREVLCSPSLGSHLSGSLRARGSDQLQHDQQVTKNLAISLLKGEGMNSENVVPDTSGWGGHRKQRPTHEWAYLQELCWQLKFCSLNSEIFSFSHLDPLSLSFSFGRWVRILLEEKPVQLLSIPLNTHTHEGVQTHTHTRGLVPTSSKQTGHHQKFPTEYLGFLNNVF